MTSEHIQWIKDRPFAFMAIASTVILAGASVLAAVLPSIVECLLPIIAISMIWAGFCAFGAFMHWTTR